MSDCTECNICYENDIVVCICFTCKVYQMCENCCDIYKKNKCPGCRQPFFEKIKYNENGIFDYTSMIHNSMYDIEYRSMFTDDVLRPRIETREVEYRSMITGEPLIPRTYPRTEPRLVDFNNWLQDMLQDIEITARNDYEESIQRRAGPIIRFNRNQEEQRILNAAFGPQQIERIPKHIPNKFENRNNKIIIKDKRGR